LISQHDDQNLSLFENRTSLPNDFANNNRRFLKFKYFDFNGFYEGFRFYYFDFGKQYELFVKLFCVLQKYVLCLRKIELNEKAQICICCF